VRYRPAVATDPLFFAGLLLLASAVAAVLFRTSIGVVRALFLSAGLLFAVAGILVFIIVRDRHEFRVTAVQVAAAPEYVGPCPGRQPVRASVKTAGGQGDVVVRVLTDADLTSGRPAARTLPPVETRGSFELETSVPVSTGGLITAYVSIQSPNYKVSTASFTVRCTGRPA
jgi:hypothetical protein